MSLESIKPSHLAGGNYFDDMRIDIAASHRRLDTATVNQPQVATGRTQPIMYPVDRLVAKLGLDEFLVATGIRHTWFAEFHEYWTRILQGRPLTILDFHMLLHDYRKRAQHVRAVKWGSPEQHVANWQASREIYSLFSNVRKLALHPVTLPPLWKLLGEGQRVLEYGCSVAPYYYCYRRYFSRLRLQWWLADIPGFPFHYAKWLYRGDPLLHFITVLPSSFSAPLGDAGDFDCIIVTAVFEHLDDPVFVANYLLGRLRPGGLLVFDYVRSEGKGLDTPQGAALRSRCIDDLLGRLRLISGTADVNRDIGLCIGRKVQ